MTDNTAVPVHDIEKNGYQSTQAIDDLLMQHKTNEGKADSQQLNKKVDQYLFYIKQFESDTVQLARQNSKRAWQVAIGFAIVAILSVTALIFITPLKTSVPFLLRVDNNTGYVSILRPLSDAQSLTYGEVLDKFWLDRFILARSGYTWETVQNSYDTVQMMSNNNVFSEYKRYILADNSPVNTFGSDKRIRIDVRDIVFLPQSPQSPIIAQIIFSRIVENNNGSAVSDYKKTNWTATITFDYLADIKSESERMINPLAFRVTSYREDRNLN